MYVIVQASFDGIEKDTEFAACRRLCPVRGPQVQGPQLLRVHHIPTENNVSDHFTKPKTGAEFSRLTTLLMGRPRPDFTYVTI